MLKFLLSLIAFWFASFLGAAFAFWLIMQLIFGPMWHLALGAIYQVLGPETMVRLWVVYAEECRSLDPRALMCPDPDKAEAQARANVEWIARAIEGSASPKPPATNQ